MDTIPLAVVLVIAIPLYLILARQNSKAIIKQVLEERSKKPQYIKERSKKHQDMPEIPTIKYAIDKYAIPIEPKNGEWKFRADEPGKANYIANLKTVECSCEEFILRRRKFDKEDLRRLCGHLVRAHQKAGIWPEQEEIVNAMLRTGPMSGGCWTYDHIHQSQLASGEKIYFGTSDGKEWINVYTRKRKKGESGGNFSGAYDKFGFNRETGRWSYGDGPPAAKEIRALISILQ